MNAKLLRRAGVEADVLVDEWHILSQPEWEDAPLEGRFEPFASLAEPAARAGWRRPDWVFSFPDWDPEFRHESWLGERARIAKALPPILRLHRRLAELDPESAIVQGTGPVGLVDVVRACAWFNRLQRSFGPLQDLFSRYDLVQAYSTDPVLALLAGVGPYIAFEHGTMREIPFENSWLGRLLTLAYRCADAVVITNPDVLDQARRLGIENRMFIPHPLDESKYTPGPTPLRAKFEAEGADFILLCPSRHDWNIKGSDRMLRGFELFVRKHQDALLVLSEWGLEVDRSKALITSLGIQRNVLWVDPMPKLQLIEAYRAADIVLDQFLIGTFGAVAPEAMACGTPVVMAFEADLHRWCFPVLPPVVDARTPEEIQSALQLLADDRAERERLGGAGRVWVEDHHSARLVVERQLGLYGKVLQREERSAARAANLPTI